MALRLLSYRSAVAVLALASLAACSDDDDKASPSSNPSMSWTVDGADATATTIEAQDSANVVAIQGIVGSNSMVVSMPKRTGTFAMPGSSSEQVLGVYTVGSSAAYFSTTGSVTVTSYTASTTKGSSVISGTFNFTGADLFGGTSPKTVTNGKFTAKF